MAVKQVGKFPEIDKRLARAKQVLPKVLANTAKNHFLQGFREGGGKTDRSIEGWQERKSNAKRNKGRAILVDKGHLRADIDVRKTDFSEIVIGTVSTPYAEYVNDGTERMPQREFLGYSKELDLKVRAYLEREVKYILEGKK